MISNSAHTAGTISLIWLTKCTDDYVWNVRPRRDSNPWPTATRSQGWWQRRIPTFTQNRSLRSISTRDVCFLLTTSPYCEQCFNAYILSRNTQKPDVAHPGVCPDNAHYNSRIVLLSWLVSFIEILLWVSWWQYICGVKVRLLDIGICVLRDRIYALKHCSQ